jgi:hypothetical protein
MRRWRGGFEGSLRGVEGDGGRYLYVCKRTLENLRKNLLNGEEISLQDLVRLPYFEAIHRGSLLLTAVDMRYEARGWSCLEEMMLLLSRHSTGDEVVDKRLLAQAFHRAQECFAENEDGIPESDRLPSELTSRDLKKLLDKIPSPASSDVDPSDYYYYYEGHSDEDGPLSEVSDLDAPEKLNKDKDISLIRGKGKGNFENENEQLKYQNKVLRSLASDLLHRAEATEAQLQALGAEVPREPGLGFVSSG